MEKINLASEEMNLLIVDFLCQPILNAIWDGAIKNRYKGMSIDAILEAIKQNVSFNLYWKLASVNSKMLKLAPEEIAQGKDGWLISLKKNLEKVPNGKTENDRSDAGTTQDTSLGS